MERPRTLGELKASGWRSRSVRDEMRENLIQRLGVGPGSRCRPHGDPRTYLRRARPRPCPCREGRSTGSALRALRRNRLRPHHLHHRPFLRKLRPGETDRRRSAVHVPLRPRRPRPPNPSARGSQHGPAPGTYRGYLGRARGSRRRGAPPAHPKVTPRGRGRAEGGPPPRDAQAWRLEPPRPLSVVSRVDRGGSSPSVSRGLHHGSGTPSSPRAAHRGTRLSRAAPPSSHAGSRLPHDGRRGSCPPS